MFGYRKKTVVKIVHYIIMRTNDVNNVVKNYGEKKKIPWLNPWNLYNFNMRLYYVIYARILYVFMFNKIGCSAIRNKKAESYGKR